MPFPTPEVNTAESTDSRRDETKRVMSPPSSIFAQSQAIRTAANYFEGLQAGYPGTAIKHRNRTRSALFVQLLAAFEFTMKDFIAQTLDSTHVYDEAARGWRWLTLDVGTVLSVREGSGRLGALLIHPLLGWQEPEVMNARYQDVYQRQPLSAAEIEPLRDVWIVRHSVAHNGGFVTEPDSRRLRAGQLRNRPLLVDNLYLHESVMFLRRIARRLQDVVGPSLLRTWFHRGAARVWAQDEETYRRLKLLTMYVDSRPRDLPTITQAMYNADSASNPAQL